MFEWLFNAIRRGTRNAILHGVQDAADLLSEAPTTGLAELPDIAFVAVVRPRLQENGRRRKAVAK